LVGAQWFSFVRQKSREIRPIAEWKSILSLNAFYKAMMTNLFLSIQPHTQFAMIELSTSSLIIGGLISLAFLAIFLRIKFD
jgi:hypothetical protein